MIKWIAVTFSAFFVLGAAYFFFAEAKPEKIVTTVDLKYMVETSFSENPDPGIPHDWLDCQERYLTEAEIAAERLVCHSWTTQGVTSTLIGIRIGNERVPVVESHLAGAQEHGPIIVDVQGGPGGEVFHTNSAFTDEFVAKIRKNDSEPMKGRLISESPYFELLERGFVIASIGYWGTNVRTYDEAGEFELATHDVLSIINHYRAKSGVEPPLLTVSLGNHLALAAVGKERLEGMQVLSLVPVMDGLQHHLRRIESVYATKRAEAEAEGELFGEYTSLNVYRRNSGAGEFVFSGMQPMHEYIPKYLGDADFPWKPMRLKDKCSRVILGSKDPRTKGYLKSKASLPPFVTVLDSDHVVILDAQEESREIFAAFGRCLQS